MLDSDIANGTCYYGYNKAAGSELVPCGNAGIANVPCCFAGDYCDADNTCFNNATGNTYLTGCTDSQYTDSSCPWKSDDFDDQEWVGLIRCNAVDETENEWAWAGCSVPSDDYTTLKRLGSCDCTSKSTLFVGEQALLRHASLPSSVGGSISWVEGYAVTAAETISLAASSSSYMASETASAGSTATGSIASATTAAATSTSGATQAPSGESDSGGSSLSTGAKAGIAVGSIGAVLSLLAIVVMVFLHRRRKRGGKSGDSSEAPTYEKRSGDKSPAPPVVMVDGNEGMAPPAYSGHKAELDGATVSTQALSPRLRSMPSTISAPGLTPEMVQSEFGDRRMSLVSELSNNDDGPRGMYTMSNQSGMAPIAELQG